MPSTSSSTSSTIIPQNGLIYLRYLLLKFDYDCPSVQVDLPHGRSVSAQLLLREMLNTVHSTPRLAPGFSISQILDERRYTYIN